MTEAFDLGGRRMAFPTIVGFLPAFLPARSAQPAPAHEGALLAAAAVALAQP